MNSVLSLLRRPWSAVGRMGRKVAVNGSFPWTKRWIAPSAEIIVRAGGEVVVGARARVTGHVRFIVDGGSRLELRAGVVIDRGGEITAVNGARVTIGAGTYVGNFCNFRSDESIEIGEGCYFGQFVSILDGGYDVHAPGDITREAFRTRPVKIGQHAWIGVGAIILPGVTIGDGAVIGAGAVVTRAVPPRAIAVGNPARVTSFRP